MATHPSQMKPPAPEISVFTCCSGLPHQEQRFSELCSPSSIADNSTSGGGSFWIQLRPAWPNGRTWPTGANYRWGGRCPPGAAAERANFVTLKPPPAWITGVRQRPDAKVSAEVSAGHIGRHRPASDHDPRAARGSTVSRLAARVDRQASSARLASRAGLHQELIGHRCDVAFLRCRTRAIHRQKSLPRVRGVARPRTWIRSSMKCRLRTVRRRPARARGIASLQGAGPSVGVGCALWSRPRTPR
jgi:hypothetical protein